MTQTHRTTNSVETAVRSLRITFRVEYHDPHDAYLAHKITEQLRSAITGPAAETNATPAFWRDVTDVHHRTVEESGVPPVTVIPYGRNFDPEEGA